MCQNINTEQIHENVFVLCLSAKKEAVSISTQPLKGFHLFIPKKRS